MHRHRAKWVAWTVSVGFHAALAILLVQDEAGQVRTLPLKSERLTRNEPAGEESPFTMTVERTVEPTAARSIALAPPTGQRPVESARPDVLPQELRNLLRELGTRPTARIEVQDVSPVEYREPVEEPKPASRPASPTPQPDTVAKSAFGKGIPLHGPLPEGASVVYILDRSTSMGLTRETFDAARAAVLASVSALPTDGRYQVVAYNSRAILLLPGHVLLKKSDAHDGLLIAALRDLKPEGDSRHEVALRMALALGADHLVFVTDADEDELAKLRPILKGHGKAIAVSVVHVEGRKLAEAKTYR